MHATIALLLLTTAADEMPAPMSPELVAALRTQAISLEILDSREVYWILDHPERLNSDLALLRNRYQQLHTAPPAADIVRFPSQEVVNAQIAFNRAYREQLAARLPGEPGRVDELGEAIREVDRLYEVWDAVRDARCDYYYVSYRRQALKRLHDLLGDEAYYAGQMPAAVPLHRFQTIR